MNENNNLDTDIYELFKAIWFMESWIEHHAKNKFEFSHHRAMLMTLDTLEKMLLKSKLEIKHNEKENS